MSQPEARLQRQIQAAIKKAYPDCYLEKIHGGPYQSAGIPDLIMCIDGWFIALEVKRPKGPGATPIQLAKIEQINRAGGIAQVVRSPQEALDVIRQALS